MKQAGFTLLEVLIALALLVFVLAGVLISQSASLNSSARTKNILIATNLARNIINEIELKVEGVDFDSLDKTEEGKFEEPNERFTWKRTIEEVDFSVLSELLLKESQKDGSVPEAEAPTVLKFFQDYLQKSVRRMTVTIEWPENGTNTSLTFTELLVVYDAEMSGV